MASPGPSSDGFEMIDREEANLAVDDLADVRKWLQPTEFMAESSEFQRHLSSQAPGTGLWICDTPTFQRWHDSAEHGSLWIKGVPGAGKSVTAASMVEHLKNENAPVLFFFFRYIVVANRRPRSLVRDWLAQLLPHSPHLQAALQPLTKSELDTISDEELWGCLLAGLSALDKAYCVVDAMDEMEQIPNDSFLQHLNSLATFRPKNIKLLMTSRPKQYLQSALRDASIVHISLEQDLVGKDIAAFISYRLQHVLGDDQQRKLHSSLSSIICTRSQGLFLYARLLLDQIIPTILSAEQLDVESLANTLPIGLEDMYNNMLFQQAQALKIEIAVQVFLLECATQSSRPLRLNELATFLAFVFPASKLPGTPKDITRSACAPLLEIAEDETIQVIHHSFTEFLLDTERTETSNRGLGPQFPVLQPRNAHKMMTIRCLNYLQSDVLGPKELSAEEKSRDERACKCNRNPLCRCTKNPPPVFWHQEARLQYPFLEYAVTNWAHHASRYNMDDQGFFQSINEFVEPENAVFRRWVDIEWTTRTAAPTEMPSALHIAAFAGLTEYAKTILRGGQSIDSLDAPRRTPLQWACRRGHTEMVSLLLQIGAKPNEDDFWGARPLHEAARRNYASIVRLLLEAGVDPLTPKTREDHGGRLLGGERSTIGETAVEYVCTRGHTETILVMIPFLKQETLEELLCQTCSSGNSDSVQAILDNSSVSVNTKSRGSAPLYRACLSQNLRCVELLLARGADVNAISDLLVKSRRLRPTPLSVGSQTPLLGLVHGRWRDENHALCHQIFRLLISSGADLEVRDAKGNTALLNLFLEPTTLSRKAVATFLESGAKDAADRIGDTILHRLLQGTRDIKFLELLFNHGYSIDDRGYDGQTALHVVLSSSYMCSGPNTVDEVVEFLLRKGARIDQKTDSGITAMELAMLNSNCSLEMFRRLLRTCSDKDACTRCIFKIGQSRREKLVPLIRELISVGVSLEARDSRGQTTLICHVRDEFVFDSLLGCGATIDATDSRGKNALHHFVSTLGCSISVERLRKLVEQGLDPHCLDDDGNNLLHVAVPSYRGTTEDVTLIQQIIDYGISVNSKNNLGRSPLHLQIEHSREDTYDDKRVCLLDLFLSQTEEEKVEINIQDLEGLTPLHSAALRSEINVACLVAAGADFSILTKKGRSVLHLACRARKSSIVGYLLAKPPCRSMIDQPDSFGRTPLHDACTSGRPESVYYLLKHGANVNIKDLSGCTPLHSCADFAAEERLWLSLQNGNEAAGNLVQKDRFRPIPLDGWLNEPWYASKYGYTLNLTDHETTRVSGIIHALVAVGADMAATNANRFTPLDCALANGCHEMVKCLQSTTSTVQKYWDMKDDNATLRTEVALRQRPMASLSSAQEELQQEVLKYPARYLSWLSSEDIDWIVQNGGDTTGADSGFNETSLLHAAAQLGLTEVMLQLRETAKFYDKLDPSELSPTNYNTYCQISPVLQVACQRELPNLEVLELLLDKCGVDINSRALVPTNTYSKQLVEGPTALHCLAEVKYWWQLDAIKLLIEKGAKIDEKNEKGETPLHIASAGNTVDGRGNRKTFWKAACVELLLDYRADPNIPDKEGRTCLNKASASPEIMRILLKRGADLVAGRTALFSAIQNLNYQAVLVMLDSGVSPNSKDILNSCRVHYEAEGQEKFALFCASFPTTLNSMNDSAALVKLSIERGADLYVLLNAQESLVHYVFEHSEYEIACGFLECAGSIDFNKRDQLGRTVFLAACNFTNVLPGYRHKHWYAKETGPAVKILDHNADFTAIDNNGRNALHHLLDNPDAEQDDILLFLKHQVSKVLFKQRDGKGFTPLHCALRTLRPAVCEVLVDMGANLLEPDPTGATALHHIAFQWLQFYRPQRRKGLHHEHTPEYYLGCARLWQKVLDLGGDVNARDNKGSPPLFSYLSSPQRETKNDQDPCCHVSNFDKLFASADPNARNTDGETALHIISQRKVTYITQPTHDSMLFKFMAAKGTDPLAEDNQGRSSLDVAAACEKKRILDLFQYRS